MSTEATITRIQQLIPTSEVSLGFRDGVWVATIVARHFSWSVALERKGTTEEEATLRLLDSVMQWKAEQRRRERDA